MRPQEPHRIININRGQVRNLLLRYLEGQGIGIEGQGIGIEDIEAVRDELVRAARTYWHHAVPINTVISLLAFAQGNEEMGEIGIYFMAHAATVYFSSSNLFRVPTLVGAVGRLVGLPSWIYRPSLALALSAVYESLVRYFEEMAIYLEIDAYYLREAQERPGQARVNTDLVVRSVRTDLQLLPVEPPLDRSETETCWLYTVFGIGIVLSFHAFFSDDAELFEKAMCVLAHAATVYFSSSNWFRVPTLVGAVGSFFGLPAWASSRCKDFALSAAGFELLKYTQEPAPSL